VCGLSIFNHIRENSNDDKRIRKRRFGQEQVAQLLVDFKRIWQEFNTRVAILSFGANVKQTLRNFYSYCFTIL